LLNISIHVTQIHFYYHLFYRGVKLNVMREKEGKKKAKFITIRDFENEELWREFKAYAVKRGLKIAQALEEAIKLWIEEQKKKERSS